MKPTAFIGKWGAVLLLLSMAVACKKVDIDFGESTITDPNIAYIDTISYQLSTIQSDSFITSATGAMMIGRHADTALGTMQAETYFHLSTPGTTNIIPDGAIYDSVKLFLRPTGAYYGDTLSAFTMQSFLLTDNISLEGNSAFYNPQRFATAATPLGTSTTVIKPSLKDTISLPINNSIGIAIFQMIRRSSDTLSDNDHYFQFIKGISIKGSNANNVVYSFSASDTAVFLRMYYHYTNPDPQTGYVDSKFLADNLQFNHIETNRSGTPLQAFTPFTRQRISSTATGNKSYIQNTGGLQLRIDLPSLRNYKTEETYKKILKAELYIRPYNYTVNSMYQLPKTLTLYSATDDNLPGTTVLDKNTGVSQVVAPTIDYLYGKDTYYKFNISNYVTNIINGSTETFDGLFLEAPGYSANNAVDRLILANPTLYKSVEIRIYRLSL